jgi:hypothetical protein
MRLSALSASFRSIAAGIVAACGLASATQAQCTATTVNHLWGEAQVVKVRNGIAYFGYPGHLQLVNVLNPAIPINLGKVVFNGESQELHLNGNYLYIAAGEGGLVIVDVSNTNAPVVVSTLDVGFSTDVAVSNATAFVVADNDAAIVDVTNPAAPTLAGTYSHSAITVESIASSGSTFFACNSSGTVDAVDASNRAVPVLLDSIDATSSFAETLVLRGNTLAAVGWEGVGLVDISNPAAMVLSSTLPNDGINAAGAISVDAGVTLMHYEYEGDQIRTYDITNPAAPVLRSTVSAWNYMDRLTTSDGDLYELGSGDTRVYDFANPAAPTVLATIPQEFFFPYNLVISGSTALVSSLGSVYSMNVSLPAAPTAAALAYTSLELAISDMVIEQNRLYLASGDFTNGARIEILDITNPAAPTLLGTRTIPERPEVMDVLESRVCVLDDAAMLRVLDASVPGSVEAEGEIDLSSQIGSVFDVSVDAWGNFVFVAHDDGVSVVDVSRPWAPTLATTLLPRVGESIYGFAMREHLAFIGQSDRLIEVFDLSNPLAPLLLDSITSPVGIDTIGEVDSLLFVYDFDERLSILDTADPADISLITSVALGADASEFARRANTLWTNGFQGVSAVSLPDFPRITAWPQDQALCTTANPATFSVTVGNNAGATYQWQRNGLNVLNGAGGGGATFTGATTSTLTITNPTFNQVGQYTCVVTKGCGATTTAPASLYLALAPTFLQHPQSQSICRREGVTFNVTGIVTLPATYQWQRENSAGSGVWVNLEDGPTTRMIIEGSQERVLTITAQPGQTISSQLGTNFRVIVTNACASVTSNTALLTLTDICCDSIDFNNDGSLFDPTDIDAFLSVFSEGPCIPGGATCNDVDFNNDTSLFDPCDIDSFLLVFSEGPCTGCGA